MAASNYFDMTGSEEHDAEQARVQQERTEDGRQRARDRKVVADLMATPAGRHWMERLMERCNIFEGVYRHDGDGYGMAWRDGQANIGRFLLSQIEEFAPESYMAMTLERRGRLEKERDKARPKQQRQETDDGLTDIERMALAQADDLAARQAQQSSEG